MPITTRTLARYLSSYGTEWRSFAQTVDLPTLTGAWDNIQRDAFGGPPFTGLTVEVRQGSTLIATRTLYPESLGATAVTQEFVLSAGERARLTDVAVTPLDVVLVWEPGGGVGTVEVDEVAVTVYPPPDPPAGTVYFATLGASLSLTAAQTREVRDVVAAQMTAAADAVYQLTRALSVSVTSAGDTTHQVLRTLVGAIATTATTSTVKLMLRSFGASMASSGALVRQTSHPVAASLSAAGALSRQARRTVAASLTTAGAFVRQTSRSIAASLTAAGALVRQTSRSIAASLSVTESLSRQVQRTLTASLSATGALARQAGRALGASLTASSTVREAVARTMTASMLQTTVIQRSVAAAESASLTAGGIVVERTGRLLSAIESATAALGQSSILTLVPDGTVSNTGWSPVGAATIHAALTAGDSDYMQSGSAGSVAEVSLSNPSIGLTLTNGQLTIRVRTG